MALDTKDHAHFIYQTPVYAEDEHLGHYFWDGITWQTETILDGVPAKGLKLAIDRADNLHLIYHDNSNGELVYGVNKGGGWQFEHIYTIYATLETDLSIDFKNEPHIIFHNLTYYAYLYYGFRGDGIWHVDKIGKTKSPCAAMEIDQYGWPVIARYNFPGGDTYLAKGPDLPNKVNLPVVIR